MRGKHRNGESGVALVSVLLLLAALSAVTAASVALGLYLARETAATGRNAQQRYLAESALNRTFFYLKHDVATHPSRTLGKVDYNKRSAVFVQPRFMADGVTHTLEVANQPVKVTVSDASGGFALTPFATLETRLAERRANAQTGQPVTLEAEWEFARFTARLQDYLDADDGRTLDGMESAEYLKSGRANLPRSGIPDYREELLWIPGAAKFLGDVSECQLLSPPGLPGLPEKVRLYSSPPDLIAAQADLTPEEREKLRAALVQWQTGGTFLEKSLPGGVYKKITAEDNGISEEESGIYRVQIRVPDSPRVLNAVFRLTGGTNYLEFYEYTFL